MGIRLEESRSMHDLYIIRSRRNPGSVDQPWITRRNAGLFASANPGSTPERTLDHRCTLARGPDRPFLIRSTTSMWAAAPSSQTMGQDSCTTRATERLGKRVNRWLADQIEHKAKKNGEGRHTFPRAAAALGCPITAPSCRYRETCAKLMRSERHDGFGF
jgi:hypothetical protein